MTAIREEGMQHDSDMCLRYLLSVVGSCILFESLKNIEFILHGVFVHSCVLSSDDLYFICCMAWRKNMSK